MAHHRRLLLLIFIFAHSMRIFGMFPYQFNRLMQQPRVSRGWRIYSGVTLCFYIVTFTSFWIYVVVYTYSTREDHLMDFVRFFEVFVISVTLIAVFIAEQYFFTPCFAVLSSCHRQLREIFEDFAQSTSSKMADEWMNRKVIFLAWIFSVRTIVIIMLAESVSANKFMSIFNFLPIAPAYIGFFMLFLPFIGLSLASAKFCAYVHAFDHAFKLLNKQIELMVRKLNATVSFNQQSAAVVGGSSGGGVNLIRLGQKYEKQKLMFEFQELLFKIRLKHDALGELVEEFFKHWALFALWFFISNFCLLVIEAFFLFTNVHASLRNKQDLDMVYALMNLRAVIMCAIELTWAIAACSNLMDNMQRIGAVLNALVLLDLDSGVVQNMEVWTIKLLSQRNAVQVYQLFDINNGLLYSIMGAVCGYLVILIQFKLADLAPTTTYYHGMVTEKENKVD